MNALRFEKRIAEKASALQTVLTLHELRKARTVSQQELAKKCAVGPAHARQALNAVPTCM